MGHARLGWALNPVTGVLVRRLCESQERHREQRPGDCGDRGDMTTATDAKGCLGAGGSAAAGGGIQSILPQRLQREPT